MMRLAQVSDAFRRLEFIISFMRASCGYAVRTRRCTAKHGWRNVDDDAPRCALLGASNRLALRRRRSSSMLRRLMVENSVKDEEDEWEQLESDLIRLNSRGWPKVEPQESDSLDSRKYRDGASRDSDSPSPKRKGDDAVADAWLRFAEDAMRGGKSSSERRDEAMDADDADEETSLLASPLQGQGLLVTGIVIVVVAVSVAASLTALSFANAVSGSPNRMHQVDALAYSAFPTLVSRNLNPRRVIEIQTQKIAELSQERTLLVERVKLLREALTKAHDSSVEWREALIKCRHKRADQRDAADVETPPSWSFYSMNRARRILSAGERVTELIRRRVCPLMKRAQSLF